VLGLGLDIRFSLGLGQGLVLGPSLGLLYG
jgi:hypothetical protein